MIEIKDLLGRFSKLLDKEVGKKEFVREAIEKHTNFKIDSKDIKIKDGVIYLNIKPIYKNEIFLKKEKISAEVAKLLGHKAPKDFR